MASPSAPAWPELKYYGLQLLLLTSPPDTAGDGGGAAMAAPSRAKGAFPPDPSTILPLSSLPLLLPFLLSHPTSTSPHFPLISPPPFTSCSPSSPLISTFSFPFLPFLSPPNHSSSLSVFPPTFLISPLPFPSPFLPTLPHLCAPLAMTNLYKGVQTFGFRWYFDGSDCVAYSFWEVAAFSWHHWHGCL